MSLHPWRPKQTSRLGKKKQFHPSSAAKKLSGEDSALVSVVEGVEQEPTGRRCAQNPSLMCDDEIRRWRRQKAFREVLSSEWVFKSESLGDECNYDREFRWRWTWTAARGLCRRRTWRRDRRCRCPRFGARPTRCKPTARQPGRDSRTGSFRENHGPSSWSRAAGASGSTSLAERTPKGSSSPSF